MSTSRVRTRIPVFKSLIFRIRIRPKIDRIPQPWYEGTRALSYSTCLFPVQGTNLDTGIDLDVVSKYSAYWEQTRNLYGPFECTKTMR